MAFEYPSTITARKEKKKDEQKKKAKQKEMNFRKAVDPVFKKKEGMKKELSIMQLEDALTKGDKSNKPKFFLVLIHSFFADGYQFCFP